MSNDRYRLPRFATAQLCSSDNIDANLTAVTELAAQAHAQGVRLLVLPENVACFAQGAQQKVAERFDDLKQQFADLANGFNLWLVAGSLPCAYRPDGSKVADNKVRSACLVFDPSGDTVARYDKIHLFDATVLDETGSYRESDTFEAGDTPVVVNTEFGGLGLMICYDLRFANLSIALRALGADFIAVPAAFTYTTGKAHWVKLLQARALDSQCFMLGSAQAGYHGDRRTFGQSCAVDAWANTIYRANGDHDQIGVVSFDKFAQNEIRKNMNICLHRKFISISDPKKH